MVARHYSYVGLALLMQECQTMLGLAQDLVNIHVSGLVFISRESNHYRGLYSNVPKVYKYP